MVQSPGGIFANGYRLSPFLFIVIVMDVICRQTGKKLFRKNGCMQMTSADTNEELIAIKCIKAIGNKDVDSIDSCSILSQVQWWNEALK